MRWNIDWTFVIDLRIIGYHIAVGAMRIAALEIKVF